MHDNKTMLYSSYITQITYFNREHRFYFKTFPWIKTVNKLQDTSINFGNENVKSKYFTGLNVNNWSYFRTNGCNRTQLLSKYRSAYMK